MRRQRLGDTSLVGPSAVAAGWPVLVSLSGSAGEATTFCTAHPDSRAYRIVKGQCSATLRTSTDPPSELLLALRSQPCLRLHMDWPQLGGLYSVYCNAKIARTVR